MESKTVGAKQNQPPEILELSKEKADERTPEQINEITNEVTKERKSERSNRQANDHTDERKNERPKKRQTIRHSFDIYADQLFALKEIALSRERLTTEKVLLGDLAKEAMDLLITKEKAR